MRLHLLAPLGVARNLALGALTAALGAAAASLASKGVDRALELVDEARERRRSRLILPPAAPGRR